MASNTAPRRTAGAVSGGGGCDRGPAPGGPASAAGPACSLDEGAGHDRSAAANVLAAALAACGRFRRFAGAGVGAATAGRRPP